MISSPIAAAAAPITGFFRLQRTRRSIAHRFFLAVAILLYGISGAGSAARAAGIDGSIDNVNNLMATAEAAVLAGGIDEARTSLAFVAKNLEAANTWAHYIWAERQSDAGYVPVSLNPLPERLTLAYYTDKMDGTRTQYYGLLQKIQDARYQYGIQQLKTMISILVSAVNLSKGIVDTVKDNPLMIGKNLIDLQAQVEADAADIDIHFEALQSGGLLVKRLEKLKSDVTALYRELRRIREGVLTLLPEARRIETAMTMARESIARGLSMPLPPGQQPSFDPAPFQAELDSVQQGLTAAALPWESGLPIVDDVLAAAGSIYAAIAVKTDTDTQHWSAFQSAHNTFKAQLTSSRTDHVAQLTALGNAWRATLISILDRYLAISPGGPVALADASGRNAVDPSLVLDLDDPRAWKSHYPALLSAPTGPAIVPAQAGTMAGEWHEVVAAYPARLMGLLESYGKAWQSAYASMSYADWFTLATTTTDTRQPYQIFVLKRASLNTILENLNAVRSEAGRFHGAFGDAQDALAALEADLSTLQGRADVYLQYLADNAGVVPAAEFGEYVRVDDTDVPGLSARLSFAAEGISVLETETLIAYLRRAMTDFAAEADDISDQATAIGVRADAIAFDINKMLAFNDAIAAKRPAAVEMADYKFDSEVDVFLGHGDHGYLFDSLEILDDKIWLHVDTRLYHAYPPDIRAEILPHLDYIASLGTTALTRFAWLTEEIWSVTDNLTFALTEDHGTSSWTVGTGYAAGQSLVVLAENQEIVDDFTRHRFLKYHKRPYTDPMGYINLAQIRRGLPLARAWAASQTGVGYAGISIQNRTPGDVVIARNQTSRTPFTVGVIDSTGAPVAGVPVTLDYDAFAIFGKTVVNTDEQGLASFFLGPYGGAGPQTVNFSVVDNPGGETGPEVRAALDVTILIAADTDGDGCGDAWETLYGFDPQASFDGEGDFDGDGLTNTVEAALGTLPRQADTDGDGFADAIEMAAGSNPLDSGDTPVPADPPHPLPPAMQLGRDWQKMTDDIGAVRLTSPYYAFTQTVFFKGRILAFGQYDDSAASGDARYVNEIWSSPDGIRWTRLAAQPAWAPRRAFAVAVHGDRLWLAGGNLEDTLTAPGTSTAFSDVWVSDDGISWTQATAEAGFGPRRLLRLHSMNDALWAIGGDRRDPDTGLYSPRQDVWRSADGINWTRTVAAAPWPERNAASFGSAVLDGHLWVAGGDWTNWVDNQPVDLTFQDVWRSADGVNWEQVTGAPAWSPRYGASLTAYQGNLWLIGGDNHGDEFTTPFEIWRSADGIDWKPVTGASAAIKGLVMATEAGLWSLSQPMGPSGIARHTLWHSRGPSTGEMAAPHPVTAHATDFSAGGNFALAVDAAGALWAWGGNHAGQLGDGTQETRSQPVRIGTGTGWLAVAAGMYFSLGLKDDGSLWSWGQGYFGQLGDGTGTDRSVPARVGTDTDWAAVAAGQNHGLAIKSDGSLWAWGLNNGGQLGDGTQENRNTPVRVGTDTDWKAVAAGSAHSIGIKQDGSVWTWGDNYNWRLGLNVTRSLVPARGEDASWSALQNGNIAVSAGPEFTAALRFDGPLNVWGSNASGQIGIGEVAGSAGITRVNAFDAWSAVSAGSDFMAAIQWDNRLWGWGRSLDGLPGDGTFISTNLPQPIGEDRDWTAVSSGGNFFVARKADGSLWAWGQNSEGQLGNGTLWTAGAPVRVLPLGPTATDTDGDGMIDAWETDRFGDLTRDGTGDHDADGLTDFQEHHLGTDPTRSDSENDGMPDRWEWEMGLDPLVDDSQGDSDGDGIINLEEYRMVRFRYETTGTAHIAVSGATLFILDGEAGKLTALDVSDPAAPALLGEYTDDGFQWGSGISLAGTIACIADGSGVFQLIDVADPAAMQKVGEFPLGGYIQGFDAAGTLIAAADSGGYLQLIDFADPAAPVLLGTYTNDGTGGLGAVTISGSRVYATFSGSAVHFIDITDPAAPVRIGQYEAGDLVWPPALALYGRTLVVAVWPWDEGPSLTFIDTAEPAAPGQIARYPGYVAALALDGNLALAFTEDGVDLIDIRSWRPQRPLRLADIDNLSIDGASTPVAAGGRLYAPYRFGADTGVAIVDIERFTRMVQGVRGDVDDDKDIDLADAIAALQVLAAGRPSTPVVIDIETDVAGDARIGLAEALYVMQYLATVR